MTYPNGRIPLELLVHLGGDHYLPPGTAARWQWMVAATREKYGVTLRITKGPNAYRWYEAQVEAKQEATADGRPQDAAAPGFSSHGGLFEGREVMAIDVANWQDLGSTPGGKDAWGRFAALCRLAGFTTLYFDWEPWHIVDQNDVWTVPAGMAGKTPQTKPLMEDEMLLFQLDPTVDGRWVVVDVRAGTYWQVRNGIQLDGMRATPGLKEFSGPQSMAMIEGLTEINRPS